MTTENPENNVDCLHCERPILDGDAWTFTRHRKSADGIAVVHVACTASGVRRWCREGQPEGSPLEAARELAWNFTGSAATHPYGRPGHTVSQRLTDARQGRLKFAPDPMDS